MPCHIRGADGGMTSLKTVFEVYLQCTMTKEWVKMWKSKILVRRLFADYV